MFNMKDGQSFGISLLFGLVMYLIYYGIKTSSLKTWGQKAISKRKLFLEVSNYLCHIIGNKVKNRVENKLKCSLPECPGGSFSSFWHLVHFLGFITLELSSVELMLFRKKCIEYSF